MNYNLLNQQYVTVIVLDCPREYWGIPAFFQPGAVSSGSNRHWFSVVAFNEAQ